MWQRRYWEHTIEEDDDFKHCLDYIHWNPVKHGVVDRVEDYCFVTLLKWDSVVRQRGIDWQFKIDDARAKLKAIYPTLEV